MKKLKALFKSPITLTVLALILDYTILMLFDVGFVGIGIVVSLVSLRIILKPNPYMEINPTA